MSGRMREQVAILMVFYPTTLSSPANPLPSPPPVSFSIPTSTTPPCHSLITPLPFPHVSRSSHCCCAYWYRATFWYWLVLVGLTAIKSAR